VEVVSAGKSRDHASIRDDMTRKIGRESLKDQLTSLHFACAEGHVEVVSVLLSAGALVEARDHVSAV
jgi:ankyrin repeat protein